MKKDDFTFDGFEPANTTPVPDVLFDVLLSELSESELKVLLYIIRRTAGFKKPTDAISLTQFQKGIKKRATGEILDRGCGVKDRATIVKALASLEAKRCIQSTKGDDPAGDRATSTYRILFRSEVVGKTNHPVDIGSGQNQPPWFAKPTTVVGNSNYGVVGDSNPQETVIQETALQQTEIQEGTGAFAQPARAFFASLPIPVTYNEALTYLAPHGALPEGYDAVQIMQLARKLWVEEHEDTPPARADIAALTEKISDTAARLKAIGKGQTSAASDGWQTSPVADEDEDEDMKPTAHRLPSVRLEKTNVPVHPQHDHDAVGVCERDPRNAHAGHRNGGNMETEAAAQGAQTGIAHAAHGAAPSVIAPPSLLCAPIDGAGSACPPGTTPRASSAIQKPLTLTDDAPRPFSEKVLRTRYEAHFWTLLEDIRTERGLHPPTYGKTWKALRDNQDGINAFYADGVSDEAIHAGYIAMLESSDAWLRNNFTVMAFFKRLQGLLDGKKAGGNGNKSGAQSEPTRPTRRNFTRERSERTMQTRGA